MPPPVRRKVFVLGWVCGVALAVASVAYAANGGLTPQTPHSPNAHRINDSYLWISIFAGAIFVLVEGTLIWFVVKYRRRGRARTVEGPQVHGATRLELIWTGIPVVILAAIAAFVFYKLPGIQDVPSAKAEGGPLRVQVHAHQFYWQFTYPDGQVSIDELHAPVNRTVRVDITSEDVDHSWWIPELGGKFDAIPGHTTHTWFKADQVGTYRGQCGEFCGVFHAAMKAVVDVQTHAEYESWLASANDELGRAEWQGSCAKCHGLTGEGGFGPTISTNALLVQPAGLEQLIRNGRNEMPPVARGWSGAQLHALLAYLKQNIYKGAPSGG
jgi:cytochrome c oxidase subunit II